MVDACEGSREVLVVLFRLLEQAIQLGIVEGAVGVAGGWRGRPMSVFEGVGKVVGGFLIVGADGAARGEEKREADD